MFNSDQLVRFVRDADVTSSPQYSAVDGKLRLAADAAIAAKRGFSNAILRPIRLRDKQAYIVDDVPTSIFLRRLNHLVIRSTNVKQSDRDLIIRHLSTVLSEGVQHRVYKYDIKSFFESVDIPHVCKLVRNDKRISRIVSAALEDFYARTTSLGITGLPRGLPLSATIAEYIMHEFDLVISRSPHVYYYARYVDDIIIVTGARENSQKFRRFLRRSLPPGMSFNSTKSRSFDLPFERRGNSKTIVDDFDFLGYRFTIPQTSRTGSSPVSRDIKVSISPRKIARIKSRLCLAFIAYIRNNDMALLNSRLQLLSGNYNIRDISTGAVRNVGLFCNYRRVTDHACLAEVDSFLRSLLIGTRHPISRKIFTLTTQAERRSLLKYNFQHCFRNRVFYNFRSIDIIKIRSCWAHA